MDAHDRPTPPGWFKAWMKWHMALHPRGPWPDTEKSAPFYLDWAEQFAERGVTEAEAIEASRRLRRDPPSDARCPKCGALGEPFPTTHPTLLLRLVSRIRRERARAARPAPAEPGDVEALADERARRWEAASSEERHRVEAVVRAANPGIERRTPAYFRLLCVPALSDPWAAGGLLRPVSADPTTTGGRPKGPERS